jgi:hypothetical protein
MRAKFAVYASLAIATAAASFTFGGCGSDEEVPTLPGDDGGTDGTANGDGNAQQDGAAQDGAPGSCQLVGAACTANGDCCSASCDPQTKICAKPIGTCKAAGDACGTANECCTFVCSGGKCGATVCVSDNQACTANDQCCGGKCTPGADGGAGTCAPLNTSCSTSGNACTGNDACCSKLCSNGRCSSQPSFCTQNGDVCSTDFECCGGLCTKAAGASLGTCGTPAVTGTPGCTVAGEVCGAGATDAGAVATDGGPPPCGGDCCSRSCAPYGPTGVFICQPPSGCRPTGELCQSDKDCCGALGTPGSTKTGSGQSSDVHCSKPAGGAIGRCDNGHVCSPAGAICRLATNSCNATDECCAGTVQTHPLNCQQDTLGIPRCTVASDRSCADAGVPPAGTPCASSADCCGLACLPNPTAGGAPFVCGGACVSGGGKCTTSADCCPGLPCVISPGSTSGTCGGGTTGTDGGTTGSDGGTTGDGGTVTDSGVAPGCTLYGQTCTAAAQCCDGIPCTNGRCIYPIF